jgi:hypothetical protein
MRLSDIWKLVATATAFVLVMSLVIAVIAWTSAEVQWSVEASPVAPARAAALSMAAIAPQASAMATPPPYVIAACHRQVRGILAETTTPGETLKVSVVSGAVYGLDEHQQRDDRYRGAYARCMRSRGFSN